MSVPFPTSGVIIDDHFEFYLARSACVELSHILCHILPGKFLFSFVSFTLQLFISPPVRTPEPRWYYDKFSSIYESFGASAKRLPSNVHLLPLYNSDASMFELDGRHLKTAFGKDFIDHLLDHSESGMVQVSLDADVRAASSENRLALVEGRVDLVRHDMAGSHHRVDVVVARAAEDTDSVLNDKYDFVFRIVSFILRLLS